MLTDVHQLRCRLRPRVWALLVWAPLGSLLLASGGAWAEEGAPVPSVGAHKSPVSLDQLLKLPSSHQVRFEDPVRGGATKQEWQERFAEARRAVAEAEEALAKAQQELEAQAGTSSNWTVAAPNAPLASPDKNPLSYRLSQQIRQYREDVDAAERELQSLVIQANLAQVPESWRR